MHKIFMAKIWGKATADSETDANCKQRQSRDLASGTICSRGLACGCNCSPTAAVGCVAQVSMSVTVDLFPKFRCRRKLDCVSCGHLTRIIIIPLAVAAYRIMM